MVQYALIVAGMARACPQTELPTVSPDRGETCFDAHSGGVL